MSSTTIQPPPPVPRRAVFHFRPKMRRNRRAVLVACPDARPPAYQAVVGCARAGLLDAFLTAYYYKRRPAALAGLGGVAPVRSSGSTAAAGGGTSPRSLRTESCSSWGFDLALAAERRVSVTAARKLAWRSRAGGAAGSTGPSTACW